MRILLDTNVLLRLVEPAHPQYAAAAGATQMLQQAGHELSIVPQDLYEFWSVATRPLTNNGLGMSPAEAHAEVLALRRLFSFLRDERSIYDLWEQLVVAHAVQGKQAHDARFVAAMQRHNIRHLLTINTSDFARYTEITAISPQEVLAGANIV
jgi:predicted nucleic acid-binding protein